jgi:hypothetical protein
VFAGSRFAHVWLATSALMAAWPAVAVAPDWVRTGGATSRFPPDDFLIGFGFAEGREALAAAKVQAAADLSSRVLVRIESATVDVQEQKNSGYQQQVRSFSRTTTQITLSGLRYEAYEDGNRAWALASVERTVAVAQHRRERDAAAAQARNLVTAGEVSERDRREGDALKAYFAARVSIADAASDEAIARAISTSTASAPVDVELVEAARKVDERAGALLRKPVSSLREAIEAMVLQLQRQGMGGGVRWIVAPLTYGATPFSSAFGRQLAQDLDRALAVAGAGTAGRGDLGDVALKGSYVEVGETLRIAVIARDVPAGRAVAGAEVALPRSAVPSELPFIPQNLSQALQDQKILGAGEFVTGELRVEVSTNKGRTGLLFAESDQYKLLLRVNKPAYVRLIYILANGMRVPIEQAYFIDASKVNQLVEYPNDFEVAPPFGVERFQAVAFTERPRALATKKLTVAGQEYEVVADDAPAALTKYRGVKFAKAKAESAEAVLTVTTTPR